MNKVESLNEVIKIDSNFKTAINLYLSLNKIDKILSYIPTKSSASFLDGYLESVISNKEQATLLIGPYGKGKSHLLLVFLGIISLERNEENSEVIKTLAAKFAAIDSVGKSVSEKIMKIWNNKKKLLPIIISDTSGDLNQSFLLAMNDALKRANIVDLVPHTSYTIASERLKTWKKDYKSTYDAFVKEIQLNEYQIAEIEEGLEKCSKVALQEFMRVYPKVTAGSEFNPLAVSNAKQLYKSISDKLVEEYDYDGIYIVFDEFSKYIEAQDGKAAGNNMDLLQSICETAVESNNAQVFITMVAHKSIKEYGKYLSSDTINSFTGIEGRIIEKYFVTSSKNNYELIKSAIIKDEKKLNLVPDIAHIFSRETIDKYLQLPIFKSTFEENDFVTTVLKGCYPLNPLAACLLLNVSEKVAQNERTLFTFISNDERNSMARFVLNHKADSDWWIGTDLIYDYFSALFKKDVTNEYVHNIWLSADFALKKCTSLEEEKIVKALAIILIVNKSGELPADNKYVSLAANVSNGNDVIDQLQERDIIYKKGSTGEYVFKTRTGSQLKKEITKRRRLKGEDVNYSKVLENITGKHYVVPRKYNTDYMMTRYFNHEYMSVTDFLSIENVDVLLKDEQFADGKVISLYDFNDINQDTVREHVERLQHKQLVIVCPNQAIKASKQLRDYEILQELRQDKTFTSDNELLQIEIPLLEEDLIREIEQMVDEIYEMDSKCKIWFFDGEKICDLFAGQEERAVNKCCENVYVKSPIINNELINRRELTTAQTKKARINIIEAILHHTDDVDFYAGTSQEATIYRALFSTDCEWIEKETNISDIVKVMNSYVESCSDKKVSASTMVDELLQPPYGMRQAVMPLFLAKVLANRNEDIIVYFDELEVPLTSEIVVNMCENPKDYSLFVSGEDLQKEKYISSLNELFLVSENRNLSDNRIKNIVICMQRWFRSLPQATRNAVDFSQYDNDKKRLSYMKSVRSFLQKVEYNPFEILFVSLPKAFNTLGDYEATYKIIDNVRTAYDDYFDWLENQAVNSVYDCFGGRRKDDLYHLLKEWYEHQSDYSKKGLHSSKITSIMTCIDKLSVYDDVEVAKKIAKAVSDVYLEDWSDSSNEAFVNDLAELKKEIESLRDDGLQGTMVLSFTGRDGNPIVKNYDRVDENTGSVLRNILEDTLLEYDDLTVNDRVGILLEMIEKILG